MRLVATWTRWAPSTRWALTAGLVARRSAGSSRRHAPGPDARLVRRAGGGARASSGAAGLRRRCAPRRPAWRASSARRGPARRSLRGLVLGGASRRRSSRASSRRALGLGGGAARRRRPRRRARRCSRRLAADAGRALEQLRALLEADAERATAARPSGCERCAAAPRRAAPHRATARRTSTARTCWSRRCSSRATPSGPLELARGLDGVRRRGRARLRGVAARLVRPRGRATDYGPLAPARTRATLARALLLARAHGADELVERLEARRQGVAPDAPR